MEFVEFQRKYPRNFPFLFFFFPAGISEDDYVRYAEPQTHHPHLPDEPISMEGQDLTHLCINTIRALRYAVRGDQFTS